MHFLLDDNVPSNIQTDEPLEWAVHIGKNVSNYVPAAFEDDCLVFNRYILSESLKLYQYIKPSKLNYQLSTIKLFIVFGALRKETAF